MAETGDGVDGKYTGIEATRLTGALTVGIGAALTPSAPVEIRRSEGQRPSETIDPTELYKFYSVAAGQFEVEAPVAMISHIVGSALARLRQALNEPDELALENHLAIAFQNFCGVARFVGLAPTFDEALSMVLVCLATHRTSPYRRHELVALESVFEKLKRAPIPAEDDITLMYEVLDRAGFDLNAPLAGVDLKENADEG